jgi:type IV secretion system protein VirB8
MELPKEELREYIASGQYFNAARYWYNTKYVQPISQKSYLIIACILAGIILLHLIANIYLLLPMTIKVAYTIRSEYQTNKQIKITHANSIPNNPLNSLALVLVQKYIMNRESFDYNNLSNQFLSVKNNSTNLAYKEFYNYMSLSNPSSPVIRYKKNLIKTVEISSLKFTGANQILANFITKAYNPATPSQIIETLYWQVEINFDIGNLENNLQYNEKFNFIVLDYKLEITKNNVL